MAEYLYETDILNIDSQVIVQQCHCKSSVTVPKGLAKTIADAFPHANFYSQREKDSKPGTIEMRGGKGIGRFVCAFYAQIFPGAPGKDKDTSNEREEYFLKCLKLLSKVKNIREVAFPYNIGCGLAKGNWENYCNMIENFANENEHIKVLVICKDKKPEDVKLDPLFINWVCGEIQNDPNILKLYPEFLGDLHGRYYSYLHDVSEDDKGVMEEKSEKEITWSDMTLEEYTSKHIPKGWEDFFNHELDPEYGSISGERGLSKYLFGELQKGDIYPDLDLIYNAFNFSSPDQIKVVVIGQDPYINSGEAMGISFSVPEGVDIPPSLRNIFKELKDDGFTVSNPSSGDLTKWCEQGVFLINSALTVRAHESASHSKKWNESFSPQLMRWLNSHCEPLVVIMWGNHAQNFSKLFGEKHKKILGVHPSPLSAHKGFFGSKPFSKANKYLVSLGNDPIDWSL